MITSVDSDQVKILAALDKEARPDKTWADSPVIAAQQDNIMVTTFHPELTNDVRWHHYFLKMIEDNKNCI